MIGINDVINELNLILYHYLVRGVLNFTAVYCLL